MGSYGLLKTIWECKDKETFDYKSEQIWNGF